MHKSTAVLVLAIAAIATPSLAAPVQDYDIFAREDNELFARENDEMLARSEHQESGALNFGKILKGAAKIFFRDEDGLVARDDEELFAHDDYDLVAREPKFKAPHLHTIQKGVDIGNGLIGAAQGLKQVITGHQRREFEELVARMEELEAREPKVHMHHIQAGVDIGNGLINAAQGLKQVITGHQRRELEDLVARAIDELEARAVTGAPNDQSGAFSFGKILKGAAKLLFRDEDGALMARSPEPFHGGFHGGFHGMRHGRLAGPPSMMNKREPEPFRRMPGGMGGMGGRGGRGRFGGRMGGPMIARSLNELD